MDILAFTNYYLLITLNIIIAKLNSAILMQLLGVSKTYNTTNSTDINKAAISINKVPVK